MIPTKNTDNSIGKEVAVIVITTAVSIALQHAAEIVVNKFFPSDNNKKQPEPTEQQQEEHLITEKDIEEMIDKSVKKHLDLKFSEYVAEQKQLNKRVRTRQS
jgi:hypothetical protein